MHHLHNAAVRAGPEAELLFCCVQRQLRQPELRQPVQGRLDELVRGSLNWDVLLESGRRHGLVPLLHETLLALDPAHIPAVTRETLDGWFRAIVAKNLALGGELLKVADACAEKSIPVIAFKGPGLSQRLYGDVTRRMFLDLDLLVRPADAEKLCAILYEMGYRGCLGIASHNERSYLRSSGQLPFTSQDGTRTIEVHTALLSGMRGRWAASNDLALQAEEISLFGRRLRVLSDDDLFIYLCWHGTKHIWERLSWIGDLAQLMLTKPERNWPQIARRVEQLHCRRAVGLGLALASQLVGGVLPAHLEEFDTPRAVSFLSAHVAGNLFGQRRPANMFRSLGYHLKSKDRLRHRIQFVYRILVQPNVADWRALHLPPRLNLFYYLLRPLRLIWNYSRLLAHSARRWKSRIRPASEAGNPDQGNA
ncbi:MAG: nucleotidyltransferase family protein [Pirellulaceae bacterium]